MPRYDDYGLPSSFAGNREAKKALLGRLENACFSDKFSDMKIRLSNGEEINCHRVIVCAQCQFFDNALEEDHFREGQTGVVDMPSDRPHAVKALLEFCYKGGYNFDSDLDICDKLLFHTDVMNVAAVYNMKSLEHIAGSLVHTYLTSDWKIVIPILPDFFSTLEEIFSPTWSGPLLNALLDGAIYHADLLLETETWESLWKYTPKFMEGMTRRVEERWFHQSWSMRTAKEWLTKALGAEALRVAKCPNRDCAVTLRGVVLSGQSAWRCDRCQSELRLH